jgi:hypothetical protein
MAEKKDVSYEQRAYEAGLAGDEQLCKEMLAKSDDQRQQALTTLATMMIMGSSKAKNQKLAWWCFENGACYLFGFHHEQTNPVVFGERYSHNLSMLKGPGEVPKGTFHEN